MIRYFAIATAIVLGCILALLALGRRPAPNPAPRPYPSTVAAAAPQPESTSGETARPLEGDAPWALSALPECFRQRSEIRGSRAYVRAKSRGLAPATWRRIRFARLTTADCRLDVTDRAGMVTRADTVLVIPPDARFYVWGAALVVDRTAQGLENVRVYTLRDGKAPAFAALASGSPLIR